MSNKELIPVKYKKKFLTPITRGRAHHLVSVGKAIWFKDKIGTTCMLKQQTKRYYNTRLLLG